MPKSVISEIENNILNIRLNRPDVHNALDPEMLIEIRTAFELPVTNKSIRAVVVRGEGKSFCAGADLNYMKSMAQFSLAENQNDAEKLHSMFEAGLNCPVPVVVHAHGSVMGGATGLLAIADLAVTEPCTRFSFSEVRIGLVPAVISPFILRKMRISAARDLMLTGRIFSSAEALSSELVQFLGKKEECESKINEFLDQIIQAGPEAVRETKALIREVLELNDWNQIKPLTTRVIAERRVSAEGQEGIGAFFAKRLPAWSQVKK